MTEECITPLRRRMIEDMTVRHFASKTQNNYIRAVSSLARFLGRSPDTATNEDLRLFQLHLTETHVRPPTINGTVSALRFLFSVTLDRADAARHLTFVRKLSHPCPCCGGRMIVIATFERGRAPRGSSVGDIRIDTSSSRSPHLPRHNAIHSPAGRSADGVCAMTPSRPPAIAEAMSNRVAAATPSGRSR
jgi:hypothetical protein